MKSKLLRNLLRLGPPLFVIALPHLFACTGQMSLSACNEVGASDVVFIGTVESIDPSFLSSGRSSGNGLRYVSFNLAIAASDGFACASKGELKTAKTSSEVSSLFYLALNRGMRVRLHVKTLFKHSDYDDDDKKSDDDPDDEETIDVWNPFGDCGYNSQAGETTENDQRGWRDHHIGPADPIRFRSTTPAKEHSVPGGWRDD